ncbi:MAG: aspartyl-phosphate phosphatase Spo0E family protein [Thermosediminibacteraceae bacterium]|nr:aspartyl-phosphate phosphatase Spo0E family protein [Thermosediminibacteraceae bacterium]
MVPMLFHLNQEIGKLKNELNQKLEKKNLLAREVYALSIKLDKLIVAYHRAEAKAE